jgi:hypothetical protein
MNRRLIAAFLIAASATATGSAFASGYGPAPHYDPIAGAPASQRGPNTQTIGIDQADADHGTRAFGGMSDTTSQSGIRLAARDPLSIYSHH